jgi:hypothetical protein
MMTPEADVTAFSAIFTRMAIEYAATKRRRPRTTDAAVVNATPDAPGLERDEQQIRREMDEAVARRLQRTPRKADALTRSGRGQSPTPRMFSPR